MHRHVSFVILALAIIFANVKAIANDYSPELIEQILAQEDRAFALEQLASLNANVQLTAKQRSQILTAEAKIYYQLNDFNQAIVILNRLIDFSTSHQLTKIVADSQKMLGIMHYFKGENAQAIVAYQAALNYFKTIEQPVAQANLYNNIGLVQASMGEMEQALLTYQQAEKLYLDYGSAQDKVDIKFNIAGLYNRLHRYDIAIKMFLEVISQRMVLDDLAGLALAYGDLGVAYQNAGDYLQAKHYLYQSLQYYQSHNQSYGIASQSHNLAEVYNIIGQIDQAAKFAKQAIKLGLASDNNSAYVGGLYSLAMVNYRLNNFEQALSELELSNQMIKNSHAKEQLNDNLMLMSLIFAAQNKTEQSLAVHLKFMQGLYETNNQALALQLAQYQANLNSEQLKQQVKELNQKRLLNKLQLEQASLIRNFLIFIGVLILFLSFFVLRRNAERTAKKQLSSQVKQRTQELESLMQELQQANEIKSQFLANMSHEIRTPLTAVIGHAEAIVAGDIEQHLQVKEVVVILRNSNHLLTIVNDILDLSRIEANKLTLELHHHDLHKVLEILADLFTEQAKCKGLTFNVIEQLPRPFIIHVDRVRLKQILINLCSNASKFTHTGQVDLVVSVEEQRLLFKVIDSGIGLNPQQIEYVFNSFSQADNSISRRFGGSGLGLCLSQQLATLMDGHIGVTSEVNQGSTFCLSIPYVDGANSVDQSELIEQPKVQEYVGPRLNGLVLLADDHQDNRRLVARLLRVVGLEVLCAKNGLEVIELCQQHQPDLILLDIQMPEMDGLEAFEILRQHGYNKPIIALTANAMIQEIDQYLDLGFDDYLSKPIDRTSFIDTVAFFLNQSSQQGLMAPMLNEVGMSDLVDDFTAGLANELIKLERYINSDDYQNIALLVHRIAGAAAMFGFASLAKQAGTIELKIKAKQYRLAHKLLGDFTTNLETIIKSSG